MLMDLSGCSRTTVSSFLGSSLNKEYIDALPKEYRKPRVYYLESISLSTLDYIMNTDNFIFSSVARFQEVLSILQSEKGSKDSSFLIVKLEELIHQIETFKKNTRYFRKAYRDLTKFLG